MPQKKTPAKKAPAKKTASKKSASKKSTKTNAPAPRSYGRGMGMRIVPYVFCIFSLVLAVCYVLAALEGSTGQVGFYVQAFFCALLGAGAFALPLVLGYVGVRWCAFNLKWNDEYMYPDHEEHADYIKAKRRMALSAVMSFLVLLMLSTFIGVIAEQSDLDLASFWSDGAEGEGGGIFGGMLSCLMLVCFDTVLSIVIVLILMLVFLPLALGFTPDYILAKMRSRHIEKSARRAEDKQILAMQNQAQRNTAAPIKPTPAPSPKPTPAPKPAPAPTPTEEPEVHETTVDELLAGFDDIAPAPLGQKAQEEIRMHNIPIGPSAEQAQRAAADAINDTASVLDFGGEADGDMAGFDNIDNIIKGLEGTAVASSTAPTPSTAPTQDTPSEPISMSEITGDELLEDMAAVVPDESSEEELEFVTPYVFPPIDFLAKNKNIDNEDHTEELQSNAKILVETLSSFRVGIKEVTYSRGPTITRYELKPEVGTRVRSIANLVDDIALNLATSGVRIEAPIPGKAAVGIEVPNQTRATVYLRDLIDTPKFTDSKSKLTAALGMDVGGNPIHFDIGKMPHLLIAGTTGSGKSICINCIIISILYKAKPEELKLILIDPKKVEFNMYKNIPHLYCPIVSEPKKAAGALASAVAEMERRFELIEQAGVRDIASYNAAAETDPELEFMPHMVIIIDELADLMMTARDEVETSICRIAQKARAAGIHMILGTQRPSVDVITGLIKANVPSRIACTVMSQVDSRTIIDVAGAENLIGRGDMLFAPVGASKPMRVQGAFVSENEIEKIVSFVKENNGQAKYNTDFINRIEEEAAKCGNAKKGGGTDMDISSPEGGDSKFSEAVKMAIEEGKISTSLMQRRLGVGYGRAAKMIDTMEEMGIVSKPDGNKPRRVLITMEEYSRRLMDGEFGDS